MQALFIKSQFHFALPTNNLSPMGAVLALVRMQTI
jgi:hypothetical protein